MFNSVETRKGSALAYGLVIMTIVAILLSSILVFVTSQIKNSLYTHAKEQSFQIAESGIHFYKWYLAHNTDGRTTAQIQAFWNSGTAYGIGSAYEVEYADPSGAAVGRYRIEVDAPAQGSTAVTVRSTGWTYKFPDNTRTIQVRFRRPSWSERAVLANDYIRFGSGTEIYGRVHSNQGIRLDGVAHNLVTSSVSAVDDPDHAGGNEYGVHTHVNPVDPLPPTAVPARTDVFEAGREFPSASVDFNGVLGDLSYMKSEAIAGRGRYFAPAGLGKHIVLRTNDTFDVRTVQSAHTAFNNITAYSGGWSNFAIPDNGVIFVEGHAWVEGQINTRRVTVVAANLIGGGTKHLFIPHGILYTNYDGRDVIGLIAQGSIEVIRDSDATIRIDGALIAQTGRVGRNYYSLKQFWYGWDYCPCNEMACQDHKTTITLYGAMATSQRYGFAWGDNCPRDTGYTNRNLYYDGNLSYYPPPYFPTGTQYQMDLWEEQ